MKSLALLFCLTFTSICLQSQELTSYSECVIIDGNITTIDALFDYNTNTKYVKLNGAIKKLHEVYPPDGKEYASGTSWYINGEKIMVNGRYYEKSSFPGIRSENELTRISTYKGVSIFCWTGVSGTPDIIYVPVTTGCEFQPYYLAKPECGELVIKTSKKDPVAGETLICTVEVKGAKGRMSYMWSTNGTKISGSESEKLTVSTKGVKGNLELKIWVDNEDNSCESYKVKLIPIR